MSFWHSYEYTVHADNEILFQIACPLSEEEL